MIIIPAVTPWLADNNRWNVYRIVILEHKNLCQKIEQVHIIFQFVPAHDSAANRTKLIIFKIHMMEMFTRVSWSISPNKSKIEDR